ncbi:MAG: cellulose biosynthesis protein BcsN [Rhizobiales bacterium]|nr:cellulose biosynthesis protein BcsN [Hyphomicrobiales bacterium]
MAGVSKGKAPASRLPRRLVCCAAVLALLAGCAPPRQDIETSSLSQRQPLERAMVVMPPGGPAIVGVVEHRYSNSTSQEIILANRARNPNQNFLRVTVFGPVKLTTSPDHQYPNDPLALINVSQELRWYVPGVKMSVSELYTQNRYGSFGYATGRASTGDRCIYAWQRIRAPDHDSTMISNQGTIAIRLRYCAPDATDYDLLGVMTGFTVNAYFLSPGWNPYGAPPAIPDELAKPGATILPDQTAFTGSVPTVTRPQKRRAVDAVATGSVGAASAVEVAPALVAPTAPIEGYAIVPPP